MSISCSSSSATTASSVPHATTPATSDSKSPSSSNSSSLPRTSTLVLSDGRSMHYVIGGDFTSRRLVIGVHGVFGIGTIPDAMATWYQQRGWLCLAPTLPGFGESSPYPAKAPVSAYVDDIRQLLEHEFKQQMPTDILVFGGSYGTVWAYAVAANSPPKPKSPSDRVLTGISPPSCLRGLLAMGGFSPFRVHREHGKPMSWMNYLTITKFGLYPPFSWFHSAIGRVLQSKLKTIDGSLEVLRMILTGDKVMNQEERQQITTWAQQHHGWTFQQWEEHMATNMSKSVEHTLDGYHRVCKTLNSNWGFQLKDIHFEKSASSFSSSSSTATSSSTSSSSSISHPPLLVSSGTSIPSILPPIVVCGAIRDHLAPIEWMRWVSTQINGAQLIELPGNHISGITSLVTIMGAMMTGIEQQNKQEQQ